MAVRRAVLGAALGLVLAFPGSSADAKSLFVPCADDAHPGYARWYLGDSFAGLGLDRSSYLCEPGVFPESGINLASFIYGPEATYEVQTFPVCNRNLSSYSATPDGDPLPYRLTTLRGVPAADFGRGRVELYTGTTTIVVFGVDDARDAAAALRSAPGDQPAITPDMALPPPVRGHLRGAIDCGFPRPAVRARGLHRAISLSVAVKRRAFVEATFERRRPHGRFKSRFSATSNYRPYTTTQRIMRPGRTTLRTSVPPGLYRVWLTARDPDGCSSRPLRVFARAS